MSDHPPRDPAGLLDRLASAVGDRVGAGAVYGPPVTGGGVTVIPVARARFGFGGGGGPSPDGRGEGTGGGGGGSSRRIGFIELRGDRVRFRRITSPVAGIAGVLMLLLTVALLARMLRRCRWGGCCRRDDDPTAESAETGTLP